jgi:hypothetical protein
MTRHPRLLQQNLPTCVPLAGPGRKQGLPRKHETETYSLIWLKFQEILSDQSLVAG